MLGADFCMDPVLNSLKMCPPGSIYDNINYYSTCVGENPSEPYIDVAKSFVVLLNNTINGLVSSVCPGNAELISMYSITLGMNNSLNTINSDLACPPLQSVWLDILEADICEETYEGLYAFWVSEYVVFVLLFALFVCGSILHNYFGSFWDVNAKTLYVNYSKRIAVVEAHELQVQDSSNSVFELADNEEDL
jgi:hypothetical protein